jgi:hypothetical protein
MPARSRMPVFATGLVAVLAPLLSLATPAQGAPVHPGSANAPRGTRSVIDSSTFAGYQASIHRASVTVSARFRLPALSCTSAYRAITPVAGVNIGVLYSAAFVFTACRHGAAEYFPAVVMNGNETDFRRTRLHRGNLIQVSTRVTPTRTTVSVTDLTTKVRKRLTGRPYSSPPINAYVGDGQAVVNGNELRVPDFGTLTFTKCFINGKRLARWHPGRYQRLRDRVQITTGRLRARGTAFSTRFRHS